MNFWLFKSEASCFSIDDLAAAPQQRTSWDGVRNYQARNIMQRMALGDQGFFYHSGKNPEIVGVVEVVRTAYPDHTAWDPNSQHPDLKSTPENPRWFMVDVKLIRRLTPPIPRTRLRQHPQLAQMELLKQGSRLSVLPVSKADFTYILHL